ncbi:MAG TPA: hypothetical protein VL283_04990 [Candidatus Baltobacteraceae bacterium]|nr:hypothetical protein [Candidatus Baltobacteraceae bacterium]
MKTLVTHVIPHLDDIAALWLLVRFDPTAKRAPLKFVETSPEGVKMPKGAIGVGVGRGIYDEHKGDKKDSAVSLVWKDLKRRGHLPSGLRGTALAALVDFVRRGDMGEYIGKEGPGIPTATTLRALAKLPGESSRSATLVGFRLLDAELVLYEERAKIDAAIARGRKFTTKWGRGIGLTVEAVPGMVSGRIAELGYAMVVLRYPKEGFLHVRATPGTRVDLSKLAKLVMKEEPEARWYLHHSKKMLLQGDWVAPVSTRTKYGVDGMIRLIRKLYA